MRALLLGALLAAAAAPAAAQRAAPTPAAAADWSQRVEVTAEGGHRMGNPAAPVKLVEYASITCSHCADFNAEAGAPLREHVRAGRVSWEVRPYLIYPSDPGIFLLLQCQAPAHYFTASDELYATQAAWAQKIVAATDRLVKIQDPRQQLAEIVVASGVDEMFRRRGMTQGEVKACLGDAQRLEQLADLHDKFSTSTAGIQGTPTFFINGSPARASTWRELEPLIVAAVPG